MANISKAERERRAALAAQKPEEQPVVKVEEQPITVQIDPQELANRIWEGQSPDVAINERVLRIFNALNEKGLNCNISLPHPDAERYLNGLKADK